MVYMKFQLNAEVYENLEWAFLVSVYQAVDRGGDFCDDGVSGTARCWL